MFICMKITFVNFSLDNSLHHNILKHMNSLCVYIYLNLQHSTPAYLLKANLAACLIYCDMICAEFDGIPTYDMCEPSSGPCITPLNIVKRFNQFNSIDLNYVCMYSGPP